MRRTNASCRRCSIGSIGGCSIQATRRSPCRCRLPAVRCRSTRTGDESDHVSSYKLQGADCQLSIEMLGLELLDNAALAVAVDDQGTVLARATVEAAGNLATAAEGALAKVTSSPGTRSLGLATFNPETLAVPEIPPRPPPPPPPPA